MTDYFFAVVLITFWTIFAFIRYGGVGKIHRALEPKSGFKILKARFYNGAGKPYSLKVRDYVLGDTDWYDWKTLPTDAEIIEKVTTERMRVIVIDGEENKFRKLYEGRVFKE